ncbi:MAG: hypothetical protein KY457_07975 [Actinobacteria bacterium]|nr:hypothetical protein [Actinomycetota bacterium]
MVRQPHLQPGRHQIVMVLLLIHVPVFAILGSRAGWAAGHIVAEVVVPLVGLWAVARWAQQPRIAMGAGAIGLMYASAVLIHLTGGVTEAHFYFFVAFGLVALYRDWIVFFAAAGFAVAHHVFFAVTGGAMFEQPYQLERPLFWATVHVTFVAVVTAVQAVGMFDVAQSVRAKAAAEAAVARADERRLTALRLHDDVVQALTAANYAQTLGETSVGTAALEQALSSSRALVTELLADSEIDEHVLVRPVATVSETRP